MEKLPRLALQGIDIHKDRSELCDVAIEVKPDIRSLPPSIEQNKVYIKSYCKQQVEHFNHALKHLRLSIDSSKAYSALDQRDEVVPSETDFYHYSLHTIVPRYRYFFEEGCIRLSKRLLADLKALQAQVPNFNDRHQSQYSCEALFRKYGSHVYVGDIHFGEIHSWGAEYSGVKKDACTVKQAVDEAFAAGVDNRTPYPKDVVVFKNSKGIKGSKKSATSVDMRENLFEFEGDCKEATLVDRGRKRVGIWEILLNHRDDFSNVEDLSQMLENAWKCRLSGIQCSTVAGAIKAETDHADEKLDDFVVVDLPGDEKKGIAAADLTQVREPKIGIQVEPEQYDRSMEYPKSKTKNSDRTPYPMAEQFDILKHLGLDRYYPEKISFSNVMAIGEFKKTDEIKTCDIPWIILQKIIMLDRKAVISQIRRCAKPNAFGTEKDDDDNQYTSLDSLTELSDFFADDSQINPADVFLAVFSCCDLNLRQTIVEKMNQCRLAVPFLFPDRSGENLTLSLWALRSTILSWHDASDIVNEALAVNAKLKIVSCLRLGRPQLSKSKLLNKVINDQVDDTFLNVDSPNGDKQRSMSGGLVEASFCLPNGKGSGVSDNLADVTMFLNLRGDGIQYDKQLMILSSLSNVVVVCVDIADLSSDAIISQMKYIHQHCKKVILILSGGRVLSKGEMKKQIQEYKQKVGANAKRVLSFTSNGEKNASQLKDDVKKAISESSTGDDYSVLNDKIHELTFEISFDEMTECCQKRKKTQLQEYKQQLGGNTKGVLFFTSDGEKTASQLKDDVKKVITESSTGDDYSALKKKIHEVTFEIIIDEMNECCQKGKKLADNVMSNIEGRTKSELLPLQQKCWKEWCKLLKEKRRSKQASGDSASIQAVGEIEERMRQYRTEQEGLCKSPNSFIKSFIDGLMSDIDDPSIDFYIRWLEMYINDISRKVLPTVHRKYEIFLQKNKCVDRTSKAYQKERQDIETEISSVSLGIEHLMRELGQIYEAAIESKNEELCKRFDNLPLLAAKLLLKGHALEIMDGDASGVPLIWVQAVFTELEKLLGDQKLLSLSVLGIQSSGKSTLLNTMFGLRFPVSAGRCTRGVYMQLVKVREESGLPFNYAAILDSEGLRATEFGDSQCDHDNELATFVIGLGNVTLINNKGENVAEINDVLQIVAHAFLRMKMVNSHIQKDRSCVFIHQNVSADDAKQKMRKEAEKLQETLDQKTKEAAELENIEDIYSFGQVIRFDNQEHIWCFPDFWCGDPPMASINSGYHQHIVLLKESLLKEQVEQRPIYFGLNEMKVFIENMWNGVLAEDFVFGFQNTLVTKAYSHLEKKYSKLKYELEVSAFDWLRTIQLNDAEANVHQHCENLKREAVAVIRKMQKVLTDELNDFIKSDSQKKIMEKWREEKVFALESTANTLCDRMRLDINQVKANHEVKMLKKKQQYCHKQEILTKVQRLAEDLKTTDKQILSSEFDKMWTEWIGNVCHEKAKVNIEGSVTALLYDLFPAHHPFIERALQDRPLNDFPILEDSIKEIEINKDDLAFTRYEKVVSKLSKDHEKKLKADVMTKINDIFRKADTYLRGLPDEFNFGDAEGLLQLVIKEIHVFNNLENQSITMTKCFEIRLVAHVAKYLLTGRDLRDAIVNLLHQFYPEVNQAIHLEQELDKRLALSSLEGSMKEEILRDIHKDKAKAISVINQIFKDCDFHLARLSGQNLGFQPLGAKKILQKGMLNRMPNVPVMLPTSNEVQLVVHIARYAMRVFNEVQDNYDKKHSATAQLEDYKRTCRILFFHTVEQTEKEVVAVEMMCGELEPLMKKYIKDNLHNAVFKEIVPHFYTKMKLIKVVLEDLADKQSFVAHRGYILNPKEYLLSWIKAYTDEYIFRIQSPCSWYVGKAQGFLRELLVELNKSMDTASKETFEKRTIGNFIRCFSKTLPDKCQSVAFTSTNIPDIDEYEVEDFDTLVQLFARNVRVLQEKVLKHFMDEKTETVTWDGNPPYLQIFESLWGCEEVCPFCNEPCINSDPNHAASGTCHEVIQHRPSGIAFWHWLRTKQLVVENCNFQVQSDGKFRCEKTTHKCDSKGDPMETFHPYKKYKMYVENWNIHPSPDMASADYWKWCFCTYEKEMTKEKDLRDTDIPKSWYNVTKLKAKESLNTYDNASTPEVNQMSLILYRRK